MAGPDGRRPHHAHLRQRVRAQGLRRSWSSSSLRRSAKGEVFSIRWLNNVDVNFFLALRSCASSDDDDCCGLTVPRIFVCSGDEKKVIDSTEEKAACGRKQVEEVLQATAPNSDECSLKTSTPSTDHDLPVGEGEAASRTVPSKVDLTQGLHEEKQRQRQEAVVKGVSKAVVARAVPAEEQVQEAAGVRARRMPVAKILYNLLTCGTADTDEAALQPVLRQRAGAGAGDDRPRTPVCPGMNMCGLRVGKKVKLRSGGKDKAKPKRDGGDAHRRPPSLPRCSQCGKEFKPHELHSHMQSCRGLREKMRSSTSARTSSSVDRNRSSAARHEHRRADSGAAAGDDTPALFLTGS
ncbi:hypothetical protein GUJ93_ZPchr0001g32660 [Zizania palustris]|uniref:Uncharacterized protein n=1 Tax=Zizania palustris TaxID=103762 RepID=A0A8J5VD88_ZIZPA|nr:hypothetical protein GUJ93_ZPchr0001g32660 [Zizania palustris]